PISSRISREVSKEVRRGFPGYVFDTVIPRQVALAEAPRFGKTILQYAPTSLAAQSYRELAEELLKLDAVSSKEESPVIKEN
ncbi:MAG: ParA family protein, partial [Candidatus Paceibacterota bacterium]